MNDNGNRNSGEKENQKRDVHISDKEQLPNLQTLSVKKEFSSTMHIKNKDFEDKLESLSREETKTQIKPSEPQTESTKILDRHKSNSSKRFEISSSHIQENSSLRFTEHELQKNENQKQSLSSFSCHTSSIKPINEEKLRKNESEIYRSKIVTMKTGSNWKTEEKTPIQFQRGKTPEEQKCTEKHLGSEKQETLGSFKSSVGQAIDSQQGKDCIQKKMPSVLSEVASLQKTNSMDNKTLHSQLSAQLIQKQV